jgi:hypothetical protein
LTQSEKTKPCKRSVLAKGEGAPKSIDEYLARVPEPARGTLQNIRAAIRSAALPAALVKKMVKMRVALNENKRRR